MDPSPQLVPIRRAAEILGVSVDTVRRYDAAGKIPSQRSDGGHRLFLVRDILRFKDTQPLKVSEAAAELGISPSKLRRLGRENKIQTTRNGNGERQYTKEALDKFKKSLVAGSDDLSKGALKDSSRGLDNTKNVSHSTAGDGDVSPKKETQSESKSYAKPYRVQSYAEFKKEAAPSFTSVTASDESLLSGSQNLEGAVSKGAPQKVEGDYSEGENARIPLEVTDKKDNPVSLFMNRPWLALASFFLIAILSGVAMARMYMPAQNDNEVAGLASQQLAMVGGAAGQVLAIDKGDMDQFFEVNVPSTFSDKVFFDEVQVNGLLKLSGDALGNNIDIDVGTGNVFASNLVYSVQGQTGEVSFTGGDGVSVVGFTINNTDTGSAQAIFKNVKVGESTITADNNDDTLTVAAGENISLQLNQDTNEITISADNTTRLFVTGDSGQATLEYEDTLALEGGTGIETVATDEGSLTVTLANTSVVSGSYGSDTQIPTFTLPNLMPPA